MPPIIKVIEGPDTGSFARIGPGETVVGKGARAALRLSGSTVSVEHFVITQKEENLFVENLSARGTQVNDTRISGKVKVRLRDKIRVSDDTVLRLETEGGDSIITQYRTFFIALVVIFAIGAIALFFIDPFNKPPPPQDWERAQQALAEFISNHHEIYPAKTRDYFNTAWRHDVAGDYKNSLLAWQQLQSILQNCETPERRADTEENRTKLDQVLRHVRPEDELDPELARIAVAQFVNQRYKRAYAKANASGGFFN